MCQLGDDATQRLRHLQLGPYTFKKDTAPQPPFVVRNRGSPLPQFIVLESEYWQVYFAPNLYSVFKALCTYTDSYATLELFNLPLVTLIMCFY